MKTKLFLFTVLIVLISCENSETEFKAKFVGVYEDLSSNEVIYHSVDPTNSTYDKITSLENITGVVQGVFTYDNSDSYFILQTNLGITVIDLETGAIIKTFDGITEIEYNPKDGFLYGIQWQNNNSKAVFAKANIETGEITEINQLKNVNWIVQGNSTFDYDSSRYCFVSDSVIVVDINNGEILNKINGLFEIEYNHNSGELIGLTLEENRKLLSADITTGEIDTLGETGINGVVQGVSTFDQENNYYIIKTEYGLTVIDVDSVSIINSFDGLTEIEYLNDY